MSHTSRRKFATSLAAAAAALPLSALAGSGDTPPPELAKALAGLTRVRYGRHLNDDELARVEKDFQDSLSALERLRAIELTNADEPDFTFSSLTDRR